MIVRLDLGAGMHPQEGYRGVDRVKCLPDTIVIDLIDGKRWPLQDDSVDELWSSHFIEHIPADEVQVTRIERESTGIVIGTRHVMQDRLFWFFDEAFRIVKPGGLFHLTWPALRSGDAFRDPTHRRFLPVEFAWYLSEASRRSMGLQHYEVGCNWTVVEESVRLHIEPRPEGLPAWTEHEMARLWDVQKAYSLSLRAEK